MNIFRPKYRMIKEKLKAFGENIKSIMSEARYAAAFWKERLNELEDLNPWDYVIASYLAYWCTDEEREFIDEVFFKQHSVKLISMQMYMSETAYYLRKEQIMNCLLGLAMQERLIVVDLKNMHIEKEIADACDSIIDDVTWKDIREIILRKIKRVTPSMRVSVEAILYAVTNEIPWRAIPAKFGPWKTVYNKYLRWKKMGLWDEIYRVIKTNV